MWLLQQIRPKFCAILNSNHKWPFLCGFQINTFRQVCQAVSSVGVKEFLRCNWRPSYSILTKYSSLWIGTRLWSTRATIKSVCPSLTKNSTIKKNMDTFNSQKISNQFNMEHKPKLIGKKHFVRISLTMILQNLKSNLMQVPPTKQINNLLKR